MADTEVRASWGRHLEFILCCVGNAVGLGNIWRFPHLAYKNGGGAFLIPYFISLVFMGIPLFCLEMLFGQFASLGPIAIWEINILFKGLGYSMVVLGAVITTYYNVIVAWSIYYFFASMASTLPWDTCGNSWNTCACRTTSMNKTVTDPMMWFDSAGLNCTDAYTSIVKSSSEEYYYNHVLEATSGIDKPGKLKWDITLCNLLAWLIICVSLIQSVKTMGKCLYFFAVFPYVLLTVLVIRGLTLDGAYSGIAFYITPDLEKLSDPTVWKAAASQIFFSLSCCVGSLTAMSSYNKFSNNILRDSIVVPVINCLTSFFAGFAVFSVLGHLSETTGTPVANVTTNGAGLVFVVYPQTLASMPLPQLWSVIFFAMMICLGMGTQFPCMEAILTALQDEFPRLTGKNQSVTFRVSMCSLGFLLGFPFTTQGGSYLLDLCNEFVAFPLLLVGFFEIVAIVWVYGFEYLTEDIMLMVGGSKATRVVFYAYYSWNWLVVTPAIILAIIVFDSTDYKTIYDLYGTDKYPEWSETLGWFIVAGVLIWLPVWYVGRYVIEVRGSTTEESMWEIFVRMNKPTLKWGPLLPQNRTIQRYECFLQGVDGKQGSYAISSGVGDMNKKCSTGLLNTSSARFMKSWSATTTTDYG